MHTISDDSADHYPNATGVWKTFNKCCIWKKDTDSTLGINYILGPSFGRQNF